MEEETVSDDFVIRKLDYMMDLLSGFSFKEKNPRLLAYVWHLFCNLCSILRHWKNTCRLHLTRPQLKLLCRCIDILAPYVKYLPPNQRDYEPQFEQLGNKFYFDHSLFDLREDQDIEGKLQITALINKLCREVAKHFANIYCRNDDSLALDPRPGAAEHRLLLNSNLDIVACMSNFRKVLEDIAKFFKPGYPESIFLRLMSFEVDAKDDSICVLCLTKGPTDDHQLVGLISCKHTDFFGTSCLRKSLKTKLSCPICRADPLKYYFENIRTSHPDPFEIFRAI